MRHGPPTVASTSPVYPTVFRLGFLPSTNARRYKVHQFKRYSRQWGTIPCQHNCARKISFSWICYKNMGNSFLHQATSSRSTDVDYSFRLNAYPSSAMRWVHTSGLTYGHAIGDMRNLPHSSHIKHNLGPYTFVSGSGFCNT